MILYIGAASCAALHSRRPHQRLGGLHAALRCTAAQSRQHHQRLGGLQAALRFTHGGPSSVLVGCTLRCASLTAAPSAFGWAASYAALPSCVLAVAPSAFGWAASYAALHSCVLVVAPSALGWAASYAALHSCVLAAAPPAFGWAASYAALGRALAGVRVLTLPCKGYGADLAPGSGAGCGAGV